LICLKIQKSSNSLIESGSCEPIPDSRVLNLTGKFVP
jgi:hypothetical protein